MHRWFGRLLAICVVAAMSLEFVSVASADEDCHCGSSDQIVPELSLELSNAALTGQLGAHDPSTLVKDGSRYYYFSTGSSATSPILSRTSTNLSSWSSGSTVFSTKPAWTTTAVPNASNFWAPEISYFAGQYHLYYSVSSFGTQVSAIGMATSPTLNTASPNYAWTDQGPVIQSQAGSSYNTIDPAVFRDTNGAMYMTFGSFWNGIYQVQLNPATGKRLNETASPRRLAATPSTQIEAPLLTKHAQFYYLFVNWGLCCQGVNSTYNIRVGRSTSPTGPFTDQNGIDMVSGGGSLFLGTSGNIIGPGQIGVFSENDTDYFSYHFYNGASNGAPTYNLQRLYWTLSGWPSATFVQIPGDFNGDSRVNIVDLYALATHWQGSGNLSQGDANGDGVIDAQDLSLLAKNWQFGVGATPPTASANLGLALESLGLPAISVPEPGHGMLMLCLLAFANRRHRRQR